MTETKLRELLSETLPPRALEELATTLGVVERSSKIRIVEFVVALVLSARTSAGGRQADVIRQYRKSTGNDSVHRGAFYARFDTSLEKMLETLLSRGMEEADAQRILLPRPIATVSDWLIVDSTTIHLDDALRELYPGTGDYAAVKVHKTFSIGRHNLIQMHLSPARQHDAGHCRLTEDLRGCGLLVDLGYASHGFLRDCRKFGVEFVLRLKSGWKVKLNKTHLGSVIGRELDSEDCVLRLEDLLAGEKLHFQDGMLDFDVQLDMDGERYSTRLVALTIKGKGVCAFLTSLDRQRYPVELIATLYRLRWEIEKDNKVNKSDLCLDDLEGRKSSSVHTMLYASLLGSIIVNRIIHDDHRSLFASWRRNPRAPLHARLVAMALGTSAFGIAAALAERRPKDTTWSRAVAVIEGSGRDPNWRRRPSVLDTLFGFTTEPGRPRRQKAGDSPVNPRSRATI